MGNDYLEGNPINYPAAFGQGIIAVGATRDIGQRSPWSSTGNHIDVVAPGGVNYYPNNDLHDIYSTWVTGYRYLAGTSMAAPHVSGLASLLKGYNPDLDNDDIEQIIKLSTNDKGTPGWDPEYGTGRVNARNALDSLRPPNYLAQWSASGASYVADVSGLYYMLFYWSLA
jgi:subtilisin family serine protease